MLELKVYKGSQEYYLELYENDPVNITYQFTDLTEIQSATGSFSQSFRIPATEKNVELFGAFFNTNIVEGYNPKVKQKAELSYNTIPILKGFIQLKSAYIQNEVYADLEIVFFGEAVNMARTLGDKKLKDLDLSAYNHTVSYSNAVASWAGSLFSGNIRYGLIDKFGYSNAGGGTPINQNNPVYAASFTPCLRVGRVLDAIAEDNGLTFESTFLATLDNYYIPFYNGKEYIIPEATVENTTFLAGLDTDNVLTGVSNYSTPIALSNWDDSTSPFFDNSTLFNPATGYFTPGYDGTYSFSILANVTASAGNSTFTNLALGIRNNTTGVLVYGGANNFIVPGTTTLVAEVTDPIQLVNGDNYELVVLWDNDIASNQVTLEANYSIQNGTAWGVAAQSQPLYGQNCIVANNAPDIKQIDFLTSLQKLFNLVFIPDSLDPTKIKIEPFNDYVSGGALKDWTDLVDYSKDVVIKPTTDIQSRNYEFTYDKDKDFINKLYQDNGKRVYGRYLIEDSNNDFATGENKVVPKMGAFPLNTIPGTQLLLHQSVDNNGKIIKEPLCKIVYWGGLINADGLVLYNDSTSATVVSTSYPYIGHYSTPYPNVTDIDLNYGNEIATHPIEASPYNNLYNTYWRNYVDQLYSNEARILEAYVDLKSSDIATLEYSSSIWLKDSYWRVLKIQYSPNSKQVSKVTFIKVLDSVRACDEVPYQSNQGGLITFQNADGTTTISPSRACCERFGYTYIGSNCYQVFNDEEGQIVRPGKTIGFASSTIKANVLGNGYNVNAKSGASGGLFGDNLTLERFANNALVSGEDIQIDSFRNIVASGSNTYAWIEGIHRGAGWWYEDFKSGNKGAYQSGSIPFIYKGNLAKSSSVELFIEGKLNNRLSLPNEVGLACRFEISIGTINAATGRMDKAQYYVFIDNFRKSNNIAYNAYGSHSNSPVHEAGDFNTNAMHLDIDTTTDTTQHRIELHNQNETLRQQVQILCRIDYTMTRL
jgi:hypothetical protein